MPDPKRPPSSAAKTLFQSAAEMFGAGPLGRDGKTFAEAALERLAARRPAAEAVKVEPATPIPIDVKAVVTDNEPAQLERLSVRFGPVEGAATLSRDEAVAMGYGEAYDYAASRPPPYVMRVGEPRPSADAGGTLGPEGPGQWFVKGPSYGITAPGLDATVSRPPVLGDRVYFTPPPSPEALRAEKRLDSFYPMGAYPSPVVLAADVIRVDPEGTVSLFVKCPNEGPYAVHRVAEAPAGVAPGTPEAACLWSWPPARLT